MKKKLCIIYTGGTIGMMPTKKGYAPQNGYMEEMLGSLSELQDPSMPDYDFIEYEPLLDSSNVSVKEWCKIAEDIEKRYEAYDGFIVLHGTDTMAYTASALSFILEGLSKPVILTGSQIPFCQVRSDARDNLIASMFIAQNYQIPEVALFFGNCLFRGNRATKISSDKLIAFDSPNYPPLARAGVNIEINHNLLRNSGTKLSCHKLDNPQIAVLKLFPGIQFEVFENLFTKNLKGLVLEAFGAGNIPSTKGGFYKILEKAKANGTIIVVCTQCLHGVAKIGAYEASADLEEAGAISGYDLTVEAAVTKLYFLLSQQYSMEQIRKLMVTDLRGELTNTEPEALELPL